MVSGYDIGPQDWSSMLAMTALMTVLTVVVVVATVRAVRTGRGPSAQDALDERYARGELSTDEYQERKRGSPSSRSPHEGRSPGR